MNRDTKAAKKDQHAAVRAAFAEVEQVLEGIDPQLAEMCGFRLVGPETVAHNFIDEHVPFHENESLLGSAAHAAVYPESARYWGVDVDSFGEKV